MSEIPTPPHSGDLQPASQLDMQAVIGSILPRGHAIHGYSSAGSERVIKILPSARYSDEAPLLGFGVDSDAELALARALATYLQREADGLEHMTATQYPHLTEGWEPYSGHASKFDNMVWNGHVIISQKGKQIVAWSQNGGGDIGLESIEARGSTALEALQGLTEQYTAFSSFRDVRERINALPGLSWLTKNVVDLQQLEG